MTQIWRVLFDTVQLQLLPAADRADGTTDGQARLEIASQGLREVATVLIDAELVRHTDLDLMWRYWTDLVSPRRRAPGSVATSVAKTQAQLNVVVLAYLVSTAATGTQDSVDAESASRLLGRVAGTGDNRTLGRTVSALMSSDEDSGEAATLWDELSRRDLPERQVVYVQSLRTAVARLLVLRIAVRGRLRPPVGEWIASVDDGEFEKLWQDVQMVVNRAASQLALSKEEALAHLEELRASARRLEANRLANGPISPERLATLQRSFDQRWSEVRDVSTLAALAGAAVVEDAPAEHLLKPIVSRGFFVEGTNYVGEDTIGASLAEQIARDETYAVLHDWMSAAVRPGPHSDDIFSALEEAVREGTDLLLVSPIDWAGDQWREAKIAPAFPGVRSFTTHFIDDDVVLLVDAHSQLWHLGASRPPTVEVEGVPLDESADSANVVLSVSYARPQAENAASVLIFQAPWTGDG